MRRFIAACSVAAAASSMILAASAVLHEYSLQVLAAIAFYSALPLAAAAGVYLVLAAHTLRGNPTPGSMLLRAIIATVLAEVGTLLIAMFLRPNVLASILVIIEQVPVAFTLAGIRGYKEIMELEEEKRRLEELREERETGG